MSEDMVECPKQAELNKKISFLRAQFTSPHIYYRDHIGSFSKWCAYWFPKVWERVLELESELEGGSHE
jgi:hypothetical protein